MGSGLAVGEAAEAVGIVNPGRQRGPWTILSDNEAFLHTPSSRAEYRRSSITLWRIPARSPDLNPIEKFWSWARRRLRVKDLEDVKAKRSPLGKTAYKQRVLTVLRSADAQEAARNIFNSFQKVCREVVSKEGAASRG